MSSSLLPLTSTFTTFPSISSKTFKTHTHGYFRVSCNDNQNKEPKNLILPASVDRRNLLVGLGGLYTAVNLPSALATPITTPDISSICKDASSGFDPDKGVRTGKCCPPSLGKTIKPFEFPTENTVRMRWPAHKGTEEQVEKYRRAIQAMRDLPEDHPHSFNSQAKIHCAYCNGGYTQVDSGFPEIDIQIHNSWLFFPFHRWYLYFYERILGKLIDDPTFALPYWKWDDPAGMRISEIFTYVCTPDDGKPNPLYDVYRDADHRRELVDLAYDPSKPERTDEKQITCNLTTVYRDLVKNGYDTLSFFGGKYAAGDSPVANDDPSVGSVEAGCHTAVHRWVGDSDQPNNEDMGNFYSAGYDPLFYIHHTNVDRMWKLWKDLGIRGHVEPTKQDWLDASYVFYDENENLVRVYNKDSVNLNKLKYNYMEDSKDVFPWLKSRPARRRKSLQVESRRKVKPVEQIRFPVQLNKILKVRVKRPTMNRTKEEQEKAKEVLIVKGIKFNSDKFVKFDVFVNDKVKDGVEPLTPCDPEYAGGFAQIPHNDMKNMFVKSAARFGLDELLEDTNSEGDEYATVALVPRTGCDDLTVDWIEIALVPVLKN